MTKQKRLKLEEKASINEDRISSLPDSLLCHILSFVPTITAMATSILSRRWRHLWKDLPMLSFDEGPWCNYHFCAPRKMRFVDFVNTVLERRNVSYIQKFRVSCEMTEEKTERNVPAAWIRTAVGLHLQELHLILIDVFDDFEFPIEVFTCESLVSLTLEGHVDLSECDLESYEISPVHLPSLKYLKLCVFSLMYANEIFRGCPVLETLELIVNEITSPTICMPHSVKNLTFMGEEMDDDLEIEGVEINTPFLERLYISNTDNLYIKKLDVVNTIFSNMVEACLDICAKDRHIRWLPELFKALCRTKVLVLERSTIECLLRAPSLEFPEFSRLVRVQLKLPCFASKFLINLLHNCHVLRELKIHNATGQSSFLTRLSSEPWTKPTVVPTCVELYLRSVEFERYADSAFELAFVAYVLRRGLVLQKMTIGTKVSQMQKGRVLKKLSFIPKGSNICQIEVDGINV